MKTLQRTLFSLLPLGASSHPALIVPEVDRSVRTAALHNQVERLAIDVATLGMVVGRVAMARPNGIEVFHVLRSHCSSGNGSAAQSRYTTDEFRFY